jgi:hypothetical protein
LVPHRFAADPMDTQTSTAPAVVPGRACGACTLCCKLFDLPELDSPAGKWCRHCAPGKGCTVHATRPDVCRTFFCGWMISPDLGPEWKPDRARLIVRMVARAGEIPCLAVNVDENYPIAWQRPEIHGHLKQFVAVGKGVVRVQIGRRQIVLLPDREVDVGLLADDEEVRISLSQGTIEVRKVKREAARREAAASFAT